MKKGQSFTESVLIFSFVGLLTLSTWFQLSMQVKACFNTITTKLNVITGVSTPIKIKAVKYEKKL